MKRFLLTLCAMMMLGQLSFAQKANMEAFKKRFKVVRSSEGKVVAVKANWVIDEFSIMSFIDLLRSYIGQFQTSSLQVMNSQGRQALDERLDSFLDKIGIEEQAQGNQLASGGKFVSGLTRREAFKKSLYALIAMDVDSTFTEMSSGGVLNDFQDKLRKFFLNFSLETVANLDDARFFYRRNVTHKIVTEALNFAKKRFSTVPILNGVSYIIVEIEKMMREQRTFAQNVLIHYLHAYKPEELGLKEEEVNKILSSVFESRINWMGYRESKYAAENWDFYGWNKFSVIVRAGQNRMRELHQAGFGNGEMKQMNMAFAETKDKKGRKIVINLLNTKHQFSGSPAVAYVYDSPNEVAALRLLVRLGQFGLSFVNIPSFIKSNVNSFANSYYRSQVLNEGMLVGCFENMGEQKLKKDILKQMLNPYIVK